MAVNNHMRSFVTVIALNIISYRCDEKISPPKPQSPQISPAAQIYPPPEVSTLKYREQLKMPGPFDDVRVKYEDFESKVMNIQVLYCRNLCSDRYGTNIYRNRYCAPCFCDEDCYRYKDCCPDKLLFQEAPNITEVSRMRGCTQITYHRDLVVKKFIRVVGDCPETYTDQEIISDCYNNDSLHWKYTRPVTDYSTNITYRNKYCAICNEAFDITKWNTFTQCAFSSGYGSSSNKEDIYYSVLNSSYCTLSFIPGGDRILELRSCSKVIKPFYTRCNQSGLWRYYDEDVERACLLYTNVVKQQYKNIFCYVCNTRKSWNEIIGQQPGIQFTGLSLATLLDLREDDDDRAQFSNRRASSFSSPTSRLCDANALIDPVTCGCLKKTCSDLEVLVNGECKSVYLKSNNIGYKICIHLNGTYTGPETVPEDIFGFFIFSVFPSWRERSVFVKSTSFTPIRFQDCGHGVLDIGLNVELTVLFPHPVDTDVMQAKLLKKVTAIASQVTMDGYIMDARLGINCQLKHMFPSFGCKSLEASSRMTESPAGRGVLMLSEEIPFLNLNKLMTCTQILLNSSQVMHNTTDNTLTLIHNNLVLTDAEYGFRGSEYAVCSSDYLNGTSGDTCSTPVMDILNISDTNWTSGGALQATALGITSMVCTCISLAFLVLTFIIYCLIKNLRNAVGVNVMGLTLTLFVAQIVYEFGLELTDYPTLCQIMGILIHYSWLSVTFWMNACTFILFLKLAYPLTARVFTTANILKRSFVYSTISPLIIVIITLVINYCTVGHSGYGGPYSCYIQNINERRFAFALPLGLLVLINISLFTFTFIKVRSEHSEVAPNREHKINILACLKLSVITGASWIFAFVYEATQIIIFAYFFTVLVGAQGVVIFFAFVGNKRILSLCWSKLGSKESSSSDRSVPLKQNQYLKKTSNSSPRTRLTHVKNSSDDDEIIKCKDKKSSLNLD